MTTDDDSEPRRMTPFGIMAVAAIIFFFIEVVVALTTNFEVIPTTPAP